MITLLFTLLLFMVYIFQADNLLVLVLYCVLLNDVGVAYSYVTNKHLTMCLIKEPRSVSKRLAKGLFIMEERCARRLK